MPLDLSNGVGTLFVEGQSYRVARARSAMSGGGDAAGGDVVAPMPGFVRQVLVSAGDAVAEGEPLLVLEAMKMEHTLRAPRAGEVARIDVSEGEQVSRGVSLIILDGGDD